MCSVVGYVGTQKSRSVIMEGLRRLEYRGYDSAGLACLSIQDATILFAKAEGHLDNLAKLFDQNKSEMDGYLSIGHTRWATHGNPTYSNAHPQFDTRKSIAVVHNGIIENYYELREILRAQGYLFSSDTDTEVIAQLLYTLHEHYQVLTQALVALAQKIEGAYAFIALMQKYPDTVIVMRKRSPLCIGIGDGEMFIASDPIAFAGKTEKVIFLPDETCALVQRDTIAIYDFYGNYIEPKPEPLIINWDVKEANGHEHFMLKEIYEQKVAIHDTINYLSTSDIYASLNISPGDLAAIKSISLIGCGTSWHAARIAQFYFEQICTIPTQVHLASEFRYKTFFHDPACLYIAISQSGETADTLEALRLIASNDSHTVILTNIASSTMAREGKGLLLTHAGREIAVASTKAFSTQLAALFWFANWFALQKGIISSNRLLKAQKDIGYAADMLENNLEQYKSLISTKLAPYYAQFNKAIFLGRHMSYPFAMEAALKLKEIAYIFSQCYPAGELKHGPLALVDAQTPIFVFSYQDQLIYQKLLSNTQEAKARGGHIISFAFEGQDELIALSDCSFVFARGEVLLGPLMMTGVMQFFVYAIAKALDRPIDKPRNLAKSVTVE